LEQPAFFCAFYTASIQEGPPTCPIDSCPVQAFSSAHQGPSYFVRSSRPPPMSRIPNADSCVTVPWTRFLPRWVFFRLSPNLCFRVCPAATKREQNLCKSADAFIPFFTIFSFISIPTKDMVRTCPSPNRRDAVFLLSFSTVSKDSSFSPSFLSFWQPFRMR